MLGTVLFTVCGILQQSLILLETIVYCVQYSYWLYPALLENLTDEAFDLLYVTKCTTISLYLTKLYVT